MLRAYYIDRIRVILTVLVIFNHATITYGGPGGWYYREVPATLSPSAIFFVLFGSVNQAYCMGFFFMLAGYFTPASYNHKGVTQFLRTDFFRAIFSGCFQPTGTSAHSGLQKHSSFSRWSIYSGDGIAWKNHFSWNYRCLLLRRGCSVRWESVPPLC